MQYYPRLRSPIGETRRMPFNRILLLDSYTSNDSFTYGFGEEAQILPLFLNEFWHRHMTPAFQTNPFGPQRDGGRRTRGGQVIGPRFEPVC